ncbi:hypothetical protein V8F06_013192 [Rhypophila decipiens]
MDSLQLYKRVWRILDLYFLAFKDLFLAKFLLVVFIFCFLVYFIYYPLPFLWHSLVKYRTGDSKCLKIWFIADHYPFVLKIERSRELEKSLRGFCELDEITGNSIKFVFNGQQIGPADTPNSLGMQNGETVSVLWEEGN